MYSSPITLSAGHNPRDQQAERCVRAYVPSWAWICHRMTVTRLGWPSPVTTVLGNQGYTLKDSKNPGSKYKAVSEVEKCWPQTCCLLFLCPVDHTLLASSRGTSSHLHHTPQRPRAPLDQKIKAERKGGGLETQESVASSTAPGVWASGRPRAFTAEGLPEFVACAKLPWLENQVTGDPKYLTVSLEAAPQANEV